MTLVADSYRIGCRDLRSTLDNDVLARNYEDAEIQLWGLVYDRLGPKVQNFLESGTFRSKSELLDRVVTLRLSDTWRSRLSTAVQYCLDIPALDRDEQRIRSAIEQGFLGFRRARNAFIGANLFLVLSLVQKRRGTDAYRQDVLQEGNLGLVRAVDAYDYRKGNFASYAAWWIRALTQHAAQHGIEYPRRLREQVASVRGVVVAFECRFGRLPSIDEIVREKPRLSHVEAAHALDMLRTFSARVPEQDVDGISSEGVSTFFATHDEDALSSLVRSETLLNLSSALLGLPAHEQQVLRLHYGLDGSEPQTLESIGSVVGLSRERVRQIEISGKKKLRLALSD